MACRCYEKAKAKGFEYFSIRYWGECWGGKDLKNLESALTNPSRKSSSCHSINYKECNLSSETECAGQVDTEYLYTVADRSSKSDFFLTVMKFIFSVCHVLCNKNVDICNN